MTTTSSLLIPLLAVLVAIIVLILPVKAAATFMGAKRTGTLWCALSLIGASFLYGLGLTVPVAGSLVAFLLSAAGFAAILGTGFLRGIGIALLHVIFSVIILTIVLAIFGISFVAVVNAL